MMNILTWLVIGLGAGVLVNLIYPTHHKYFTGTIFAGMVGAFVGGIVYSALKLGVIAKNIDPVSLVVSLIGALLLLLFIGLLMSSEESEKNPV